MPDCMVRAEMQAGGRIRIATLFEMTNSGSYSDGSSDRAYMQEICTFDQNEGPKPLRKINNQVCVFESMPVV